MENTVTLSIERYHELQKAEKGVSKIKEEYEEKLEKASGQTIYMKRDSGIIWSNNEEWIKTNDEAIKVVSEMLRDKSKEVDKIKNAKRGLSPKKWFGIMFIKKSAWEKFKTSLEA